MATTALVEIEPIQSEFVPMLEAIERRALDMLPAYEAVYAAFLSIEAKRFGDEGPGWAELAESTVAERSRLGYGGDHPILERTKALRSSLTSRSHPDAVFKPELDGVFMGTSDPIARYHQDGTDKMPARPVVDLSEEDAVVFGEIISEYLFGGIATTATAGSTVFSVASIGL